MRRIRRRASDACGVSFRLGVSVSLCVIACVSPPPCDALLRLSLSLAFCGAMLRLAMRPAACSLVLLLAASGGSASPHENRAARTSDERRLVLLIVGGGTRSSASTDLARRPARQRRRRLERGLTGLARRIAAARPWSWPVAPALMRNAAKGGGCWYVASDFEPSRTPRSRRWRSAGPSRRCSSATTRAPRPSTPRSRRRRRRPSPAR